nr:hypothetical protein [Streptomyces sp. N2A]
MGEVFERYHACWEARERDRIAELHTADSVFHLHSGQAPVRGAGGTESIGNGMSSVTTSTTEWLQVRPAVFLDG